MSGTRAHVVVHARGNALVTCQIVNNATDRHRADVAIGWVDAMMLGLPGDTIVRCVPKLWCARRPRRVATIGHAAREMIFAAAQMEAARIQDEQAWLSARWIARV